MQAEEKSSRDHKLVSGATTRLHYLKENRSYDIDIGSLPKLEDLNRNLEHYLLPKEKLDNKPKLLYYLKGTKKLWIKDEEDYKNYLKQRKYSNHLDLYWVEKRAPLLNSFEENAKRLIQTYKLKGQISKQGKNAGHEAPKESWLQGNWLKWAETHINREKYNEFRIQVDSMFSTETKQNVIYESYEMTDDLLQELECFESDAKRYNHAESSLYCVLLSIYSKIAENAGYKVGQMDKTLWKLFAWKESNTLVESNQSVENFKIINQAIVTVPTIHTVTQKQPVASQMSRKNSKHKSIDMFSQEKLSPEDQKLKYIAFDRLHDTASHFLKNHITQEQFRKVSAQDRIMSDDQVWKFIQEVARAKKAYVGQYVHKAPTSPQDGILLPFDDSEKVGILGDWGSGLPDSFDLLDELVLNRGATIILHLGDVYYAGFPEEFKKISDKIKELRKKVPSLRYYTIPGNHDFYTNGGPFYDSLNDYNDKQEYKQHFGFFCLRNKSNTVQYIGLDTGFSQRGATDQQSPTYEGAFVGFQELHWAKEKIQNFSGQTILLTHHQAFSPYERTIGKLTNFGYYNNQLDPKLCQQLFEILPKVSVWYWGHEHRLNIMKPNAYGIPCTRTLGNSSFQVHKQTTYELQYNQYNPIIARWNPGRNDKDYFDHTGAVMTFANYKINVRYIDMTSSYKQPSRVTREFEENITRPVHDKVYTNRPYRIKDSSGLSYSYYDSTDDKYIWLHYKPEDFIFQKSDDPTYTGPITSGMEVHIKVAGKNHYLYLNSYVKANKNRLSGAGKFKFVKINMRKKRNNTNIEIRAGDNLQLINCKDMNNNFIGRSYQNFNIKSYYCLATGSNTEYTSVQIYDPTQSNTDIGQ